MEELIRNLIDDPYLQLMLLLGIAVLSAVARFAFKNDPPPSRRLALFSLILSAGISGVSFTIARYLFLYMSDWALFLVFFVAPFWISYQLLMFRNNDSSKDKRLEGSLIVDAIRQISIEPLKVGYQYHKLTLVLVVAIITVSTLAIAWRDKWLEDSSFSIYIDPQFIGSSNGEDDGVDQLLETFLEGRPPISIENIEVGTMELDKRRADLELTLQLIGFETCDSNNGLEVRWDWSSPEPYMQSVLDLYLESSTRNSPEKGGKVCRWTQTGNYFAALITFVHGLNLFYANNNDRQLSVASFNATIQEMETATEDISLEDEDLVWLPRQIMSCALVLRTLANGEIATEQAITDLRLAQNPFSETPQPNGYCIARAHYLMGRAYLEQYNELLSAPERFDKLQAANWMFSQAIEIQRQVDPATERLIDYHFYRALTHYRLGQFQLALDELNEVEISQATNPANLSDRLTGGVESTNPELNDVSLGMLSYFQARIALEAHLYQEWLSEACPPMSQPLEDSLDDRIGALISTGSIAAHEKWLSKASLPSLPHYHAAHYYLIEGSDTIDKVIEHAERAMQLSKPGESPNLDLLLASVYDQIENPLAADELWSEFDRDRFLQLESAPAYVLAFSPLLDPVLEGCRSSNPYNVQDKPVIFRWAIRNQFEEPVFKNPSTGVAYRVELNGKDTGRKLQEIGYGLFESELIDSFTGIFEATEWNNDIVLVGSQHAALIYDTELGVQTFPVGIYRMSLTGKLQPETIEGIVTEEQSISAYVVAKLAAKYAGEVTELSVSGLELHAAPLRRSQVALAASEQLGVDEPPWQPIAEDKSVRLLQTGSTSAFGGNLEFMPPENAPAHDYGVRISVVDRYGRRLAEKIVPIEGLVWPR